MNNEFDESLEKLGKLYEEGKDCLAQFNHIFSVGHPEEKEYLRLYNILREMRDLAAVNMQKLHIKSYN